MPSARISKELNDGIYFVTPTIWNWYYIFDRHDRWQILADSLAYCQQNKGLKIFAYVFMLNHLHLIFGSDDAGGLIRDFKRFTTQSMRQSLEQHEPNVLSLFLDEDGKYQFWKSDNKPKRIETEAFFLQKMNYIHENPVRKDYVERPEYWKWSSANPNSPIPLTSIYEV